MNIKTEYQEIAFALRNKIYDRNTYTLDLEKLMETVIEQQCLIHTLIENNSKLERNFMNICRLLVKAEVIEDVELVHTDGIKESIKK